MIFFPKWGFVKSFFSKCEFGVEKCQNAVFADKIAFATTVFDVFVLEPVLLSWKTVKLLNGKKLVFDAGSKTAFSFSNDRECECVTNHIHNVMGEMEKISFGITNHLLFQGLLLKYHHITRWRKNFYLKSGNPFTDFWNIRTGKIRRDAGQITLLIRVYCLPCCILHRIFNWSSAQSSNQKPTRRIHCKWCEGLE